MNSRRIFVAGARRLPLRVDTVVGLENQNEYYDAACKHGDLVEAGQAAARPIDSNSFAVIRDRELVRVVSERGGRV